MKGWDVDVHGCASIRVKCVWMRMDATEYVNMLDLRLDAHEMCMECAWMRMNAHEMRVHAHKMLRLSSTNRMRMNAHTMHRARPIAFGTHSDAFAAH